MCNVYTYVFSVIVIDRIKSASRDSCRGVPDPSQIDLPLTIIGYTCIYSLSRQTTPKEIKPRMQFPWHRADGFSFCMYACIYFSMHACILRYMLQVYIYVKVYMCIHVLI